MKTYYRVTSSVDDHGRYRAHITGTAKANRKPSGSVAHTPKRDVYTDWFEDNISAELFCLYFVNP